MIVIFYSCPVWPLNIWEFKRRPSASSSAPAGAILCLGINALNMRRRFRSSPSVSLFETIEVATEARAIEAELNFPTDYRYICAGLIASGQLRAGEQLIDVSQAVKPGTLTVFLEPLFEGGLDGVTPGSAVSPAPIPAITTGLRRRNLGPGPGCSSHGRRGGHVPCGAASHTGPGAADQRH